MIYLWHNTTTGVYEMGTLEAFSLIESTYEVTLFYKFRKEEVRQAKKILLNLNRASIERNIELEVA